MSKNFLGINVIENKNLPPNTAFFVTKEAIREMLSGLVPKDTKAIPIWKYKGTYNGKMKMTYINKPFYEKIFGIDFGYIYPTVSMLYRVKPPNDYFMRLWTSIHEPPKQPLPLSKITIEIPDLNFILEVDMENGTNAIKIPMAFRLPHADKYHWECQFVTDNPLKSIFNNIVNNDYLKS